MCHLSRKLTKCLFHIHLMCLKLSFSSRLQLVATARPTKIIKILMSASRTCRPRFLDLVRNLSIFTIASSAKRLCNCARQCARHHNIDREKTGEDIDH